MDNNNIHFIRGASPEAAARQPTDDGALFKHSGGNGGGGNMYEARIARLVSDVEYIKRDISEIKNDVKSIDGRLSRIESGISSLKTTAKATGVVVSVVFATCAYIFGSYITKVIDAINGLILR